MEAAAHQQMTSGTGLEEEQPPEPTMSEKEDWLREQGLLPEALSAEKLERRYQAFSKCQFGDGVPTELRQGFMWELLSVEDNLAATQYCIGEVKAPEHLYRLELDNNAPISSKPMKMSPKEEAWLDSYLDELLAKKVITPILPTDQPP